MIQKVISLFLVFFSQTIYFFKITASSLRQNQYSQNQTINFVFLGLDPRDDSLEKTEVTDTIIFSSLNLKDSKISLVSLPRDLWFYPDNSKINQIYPLAKSKTDQPFPQIKEKFSYLTGQKITHVVVFTTDNLAKLVNILGGVDVYLEQGFKDDQYPNPEYIKNPSPSIPVYITVEFPSGNIHLDKSNVSQFVRSRKGSDLVENGGTDIARIKRQQLLIESILNKLKSTSPVTAVKLFPPLYQFFHQELSSTLSDQDLSDIVFSLGPNIKNLSLQKTDLPIGLSPKDTGVIYYPGRLYQRQWVYLPRDKDYSSLQLFINQSL